MLPVCCVGSMFLPPPPPDIRVMILMGGSEEEEEEEEEEEGVDSWRVEMRSIAKGKRKGGRGFRSLSFPHPV